MSKFSIVLSVPYFFDWTLHTQSFFFSFFFFFVISSALKPYSRRGRILKHNAMVSSLNLNLFSIKPWFQYCSEWSPVFVEKGVCCSVAGACFFNYGKLIALKMINFSNDWSHKQCKNNICWAFDYSCHLTLSFPRL